MGRYAVVKTGGKQYRVAEGELLDVERLGGEVGATVTLDEVLLVSGGEEEQARIGTPVVEQAEVTAEIVKQGARQEDHRLQEEAAEGLQAEAGPPPDADDPEDRRNPDVRRKNPWRTRNQAEARATVATVTDRGAASSATADSTSRRATSWSVSWHQDPPGQERRHGAGLHAVRPGRGHGGVSTLGPVAKTGCHRPRLRGPPREYACPGGFEPRGLAAFPSLLCIPRSRCRDRYGRAVTAAA